MQQQDYEPSVDPLFINKVRKMYEEWKRKIDKKQGCATTDNPLQDLRSKLVYLIQCIR